MFQAAGTAAAIAVLACGCTSADDWSQPRAAGPTPVGALGAGFVPSAKPSPEATITPRPGSWDDVHPSKGYRVVLLTAGDDAQTKTLVTAVQDWAKQKHVSLKTVQASASDDYIARIGEAMDLHPDLIVAAGNNLVDPLAMVTPNHLDQQFLVVGAELAEPTGNVTAADWTGASFRGEGLGASSSYDPATFTPSRAAAAIRAGVASVLTGLTGIVLWLP
nr:BMP family ABC transporter substrate-binding protein [Streptomyces sp. SID13031]